MTRLGRVLTSIVCTSTVLLCVGDNAAAPPTWKTDSAFQQALENQFDVVSWPQGTQIRDQLRRLANRERVAIFLDRRIDPGQHVSFSARRITLATLLDRLAAKVNGTTVHVGSVVYIGPRDEISGLSRVAAQRAKDARGLPDNVGRPFLVKRAWQWDRLTEPHVLLDELAAEAGVTLDGMARIPHDLWPHADLPPLTWTDRLTILLTGFGLTFELSEQGRTVRLVPFPEYGLVAQSYTSERSLAQWDRIAERFPHARMQRSPGSIMFKGTVEEHNRLRQLLARQSSARPARRPQRKTVHSLRVNKQPVGAILKTFEQELQLRLEFAPNVREKLQTRVTFDVRNVSLDELLTATLTPAALRFRRDGKVVRIQARP